VMRWRLADPTLICGLVPQLFLSVVAFQLPVALICCLVHTCTLSTSLTPCRSRRVTSSL
jgi:hypothetical protein